MLRVIWQRRGPGRLISHGVTEVFAAVVVSNLPYNPRRKVSLSHFMDHPSAQRRV